MAGAGLEEERIQNGATMAQQMRTAGTNRRPQYPHHCFSRHPFLPRHPRHRWKPASGAALGPSSLRCPRPSGRALRSPASPCRRGSPRRCHNRPNGGNHGLRRVSGEGNSFISTRDDTKIDETKSRLGCRTHRNFTKVASSKFVRNR